MGVKALGEIYEVVVSISRLNASRNSWFSRAARNISSVVSDVVITSSHC